jgi:hypothetical protein
VNAPVAATPVNWKAVAIGVGVSVGGFLVLTMFHRLFPFDHATRPLWAMMALGYGLSAVVDIASGAAAGWVARARGALHGLVTGVIANLLSPLLSYVVMFVQGRGEVPIDFATYLAAIALPLLAGIVLATIAGAVAARISARSATP